MEFSLGLVEVSSLGNAIKMLDEMTKVADVEFVAVERKLGGRLVTIVVRGSVSAVNASVAAGKAAAESMN
ncbi:MAG: BMC domain-containing protein, partial [Clostridia bacterium]|nr:BMC domain-containing protein [Clostridia bacterium]